MSLLYIYIYRAFHGCSGKESACQCRRLKGHRLKSWVRKIPSRRKWQVRNGNWLQYSCLENSMDRGVYILMESQRIIYDWVTEDSYLLIYIYMCVCVCVCVNVYMSDQRRSYDYNNMWCLWKVTDSLWYKFDLYFLRLLAYVIA